MVIIDNDHECQTILNHITINNSFIVIFSKEADKISPILAELVIHRQITRQVVAVLTGILRSLQLKIAAHRNFQPIIQQSLAHSEIKVCAVPE